MTMVEQIQQLLEQAFTGDPVQVQANGNHFHITLCSAQFVGLSPVKQQQAVYRCLHDAITQGDIHALTLSLSTPDA